MVFSYGMPKSQPCFGVLQCVVVRYSALQCVAVCCSMVFSYGMPKSQPCFGVLQCVVVRYSALQCVAVCFSVVLSCEIPRFEPYFCGVLLKKRPDHFFFWEST